MTLVGWSGPGLADSEPQNADFCLGLSGGLGVPSRVADEVFEITGRSPLLDIAFELEKIALEDEYFVSRKLYPNVDVYSAIIYQALGLPVAMFPVMFTIPRTAGWLARWLEGIQDPEQKIARPRQIYTGAGEQQFLPEDERSGERAVAALSGENPYVVRGLVVRRRGRPRLPAGAQRGEMRRAPARTRPAPAAAISGAA